MKLASGALAVLLLSAPVPLLAQSPPKATPKAVPTQQQSGGGISVQAGPEAPKGAVPAEIDDLRLLGGLENDPFALERLGLGSIRANDLARARSFFEKSWKLGQLPTAAYNLACLDAREKKTDAAFAGLDRALGAGFDDADLLRTDPDLAPLRESPRFKPVLDRAEKNRVAGDAAAVKEGIFVAPKEKPVAILVLLHDAASSPLAVSGPFLGEAGRRALFVAVPRGPGTSAERRFGWGSAERAGKAVDGAIAEARKRAKDPKLPVLIVGVGRGGTEAFTVAARKASGSLAGVGSIGGPFDPGAAPKPAGLLGARLFLGIPRDAEPARAAAFRRGIDALRQMRFTPGVTEWPGPGDSFPSDPARAVTEALDALGVPPGH
jgi:hypothetical protein